MTRNEMLSYFENIPKEHQNLVFYPMVPRSVSVLPDDYTDWYWEPKYDGWHVIFVISDNLIGCYSKNLKISLNEFDGLQKIFERLDFAIKKRPTTLIGELVAHSGVVTDVPRMARQGGVFPKFFDVVSEEILAENLRERRKYLTGLPLYRDWIVQHEKIRSIDNLRSVFLTEKQCWGVEGLVIKNPKSFYQKSRIDCVDSPHWIKIKGRN
jgi:ATP-dependent DNA ligase